MAAENKEWTHNINNDIKMLW